MSERILPSVESVDSVELPKIELSKMLPTLKGKCESISSFDRITNTIFYIYVNDQCAPMYKHVTYTMFVLVQVDMEVDFQLPRAEETSNIFEIAFSCKCNIYYGSWLV